MEAFSAAFNEHDVNKLSSLWAQDPYYINLSTEESAQGNDNIASYFTEQFSQDGNGAKSIKIQLSSISFPSHSISYVLPMMIYTLGFGFAAAPLNRITLTATTEQKGSSMAIFYLAMATSGTLTRDCAQISLPG